MTSFDEEIEPCMDYNATSDDKDHEDTIIDDYNIDGDFSIHGGDTTTTAAETIIPTFANAFLVRLKFIADARTPNPNVIAHLERIINKWIQHFGSDLLICDLRNDDITGNGFP